MSIGAYVGQARALGVDIDRIERSRAADIEAVALGAAKTDVGDDFGNLDLADQRAVGRID